jgi:Flp pilus assembly pilin Flp
VSVSRFVRAERGVTVVEVLVAVLLISLALAPLMQLYPGLLAADQDAEVEMRVGTAASRQMETLIVLLRGSAAVGSGSAACPDLPNCRLEWEVAEESSSAVAGVGQLRTVGVVGCLDADGNANCGPSEVQVRFDAKVTTRP